MTQREIVLAQINHEETPVVPYSLLTEESVAAQLDAHYGNKDWRKTAERYMTFVSAADTDPKQPINDKYARDGYGGVWRQDMRPWHLEIPPLSTPSFEGYTFPKPEVFYRPEWKEKAFETCREYANTFRIGNLGWGLFERSWNLRGFENILMDALAEPDFFAEALDRILDLYLALVDYTCELPVDAIIFGDDWGDQRGVTLGPDRWRTFLKPRWAKLYEAVHKHGKVIIQHSCGSVADIIPDLIEIKLDVLESCQPEAANMNPYELKKKFGDRITFWGCLGSQSTIPTGTPASIRNEIARLKREMSAGGGYILAPAKPLQPETPIQNAVAILEAFANDSRG